MKWCAYDAEGDAGETGLIGVSIVSDVFTGYIKDKDHILDELRRHAAEKYIFVSHNAQYDIPVVFWQLKEDARIITFNGQFNHAKWRWNPKKKDAVIWDSLGLAGLVPLSHLGKAIGLPKLKTPQKLLGIDPNKYKWQCERHQEWECEECYAIRDSEIVYRYMQTYEEFLGEYFIKPKRKIASAAVHLWKTLDTNEQVQLPLATIKDGHVPKHHRGEVSCECDACVIKRCSRDSYYGGRVECFKVGTINNIYTADVTSMYPYVMSVMPMPSALHLLVYKGKQCNVNHLDLEGVSEATVFVDQCYVPVLPVRRDSKLLFPVGIFRGTWCNCELRAALNQGAQIKQLHYQVVATENTFPFSMFVGVLNELRQKYKKEQDARQQTVKILLNSLYGRLAIKDIQEESHIFMMPPNTSTWDFPDDCIINTDLGPAIIQDKFRFRQSPDANIMWGSYVTAYARLELFKHIQNQGDNVVYCDTDSVYSLSPINGLSEGLGGLSDSGRWDIAHIVGPKIYSLELSESQLIERYGTIECEEHGDYACKRCWNIWKSKGVPKRVAMEYLQTGHAEFTRPAKPREAIKRNLIAGAWYQTQKISRSEYTKRQITDPHSAYSGTTYSDTLPFSF